nr:zinc finger, RING/FYVE/PHD-type [Tanacetum cinerariifolium]GEX55251.1 zinc finger, RING/FYVE/PHD-type [Tanacetum cinerariifolium]
MEDYQNATTTKSPKSPSPEEVQVHVFAMPSVVDPLGVCTVCMEGFHSSCTNELLIESVTTDLDCFDDDFATKAKERFNKSLEGLYNINYLKYGNPTQSTSAASSSRSHSGNPMTQLLNLLKENSNKRAKNDRLSSNEYERYVTTDFISHISTDEFAIFDVLGVWKAKELMFLVLSRMAQDIISVQATLVAFESDFSTSGRVLPIRRTRLTPASLEMCMCLKDHLDATDRIQHTSNLENSLDFEEEILDEGVLANEAISLSDKKIAIDEARSNRSGEEIEITSD